MKNCSDCYLSFTTRSIKLKKKIGVSRFYEMMSWAYHLSFVHTWNGALNYVVFCASAQ